MRHHNVSTRLLVALSSILFIVIVFVFARSRRQDQHDEKNEFRSFHRTRTLSFSNQGAFKILQLTDMHIGEAEDLDWGPEQDRKTYRLLSSLIEFENPNLILLSGDILTGNNCDENATAYYQQMGEFVESFGIPWAVIFGNHDDADYEYNNGTTVESKTKRPQLAESLLPFPRSLTRIGPSNVTGTSNYVLEIYDSSSGSNNVVSQIVLLDSGGGSLPTSFDASQVKWFQRQLNTRQQVPTVVFQHIPTVEFEYDQNKCLGTHKDGVAYLSPDAGMMKVMESSENKVLFVAVGHNHGNDYCCHMNHSSLHLCFGRHSGYGGYTAVVNRGARVYELHLSPEGSQERNALQAAPVSWTSWVRLENGEIVDSYNPLETFS